MSAKDNQLRLYKFMFHPRVAGLYFLGLIQPLGAIMPIAERQSALVARHLTGAYALPGHGEIEHDIDQKLDAMRRRYVASKRHTIQVDYDDYMREMSKEMAKGASRAASPVHVLAVVLVPAVALVLTTLFVIVLVVAAVAALALLLLDRR